jgi:hypothetical protein
MMISLTRADPRRDTYGPTRERRDPLSSSISDIVLDSYDSTASVDSSGEFLMEQQQREQHLSDGAISSTSTERILG